MHRTFALAAAAFLIAAPITLAQTNPPTTSPPAATAPATPAPSAQPAPAPAAPAATPAPSSAPAASTASNVAPQGCRTHKAVGESCACLSDTSRIGTSTAHPDGHNVCVRPT